MPPFSAPCGANSHYSASASQCQSTCKSLVTPNLPCENVKNYICECDLGYVKAADGSCVEVSTCPCVYENKNRPVSNRHVSTKFASLYPFCQQLLGSIPRPFFLFLVNGNPSPAGKTGTQPSFSNIEASKSVGKGCSPGRRPRGKHSNVLLEG